MERDGLAGRKELLLAVGAAVCASLVFACRGNCGGE